MSFFDFFKFDSHSKDTEKARQEAQAALIKAAETLNIDVAVMAHENWKLRLETYLAGKSQEDLRPEVVCCDERCDLGKWIHGDGEEHLGQYMTFQDLKATHKMFHYTASNVLILSQAGKQEEAQALLHGELSKLSNTVRRRLTDLKALL
ncbi:CZB domain-containing protein [Pseudomonas stutzeri]|nr:CZB domain-containing protein [Stutzerimonas stutzeri]